MRLRVLTCFLVTLMSQYRILYNYIIIKLVTQDRVLHPVVYVFPKSGTLTPFQRIRSKLKRNGAHRYQLPLSGSYCSRFAVVRVRRVKISGFESIDFKIDVKAHW